MEKYQYRMEFYTNQIRVSTADDLENVGPEWIRHWADITQQGTLVVYRRVVKHGEVIFQRLFTKKV